MIYQVGRMPARGGAAHLAEHSPRLKLQLSVGGEPERYPDPSGPAFQAGGTSRDAGELLALKELRDWFEKCNIDPAVKQ